MNSNGRHTLSNLARDREPPSGALIHRMPVRACVPFEFACKPTLEIFRVFAYRRLGMIRGSTCSSCETSRCRDCTILKSLVVHLPSRFVTEKTWLSEPQSRFKHRQHGDCNTLRSRLRFCQRHHTERCRSCCHIARRRFVTRTGSSGQDSWQTRCAGSRSRALLRRIQHSDHRLHEHGLGEAVSSQGPAYSVENRTFWLTFSPAIRSK